MRMDYFFEIWVEHGCTYDYHFTDADIDGVPEDAAFQGHVDSLPVNHITYREREAVRQLIPVR